MRVAPDQNAMMLAALAKTTAAENQALTRMSTGRRVNAPSDDPAAAAAMVDNDASQARNDVYTRNADTLQERLQTADSTLNSVVTALQRAMTLGVQGANGTLSPQDQQAIAAEVGGIRAEILGLANSSFQGSFLFAGTNDTQPPYIDNGDGTVTYHGNTATNTAEISEGQSMGINLPGSTLFGAAGADVFQALSNLQQQLNTSGDVASANTQLSAAYNNVVMQRVFYGNAMNQLQRTQQFLGTEKVDLSQQQQDLVGADMAETTSTLTQAETARTALLEASSKVSQYTLFDFIPG